MSLYLVSQVTSEVVVLPAQILIIQLGQSSCQDVFTAEKWVMTEDQSRNIYVQSVVSFWICCPHHVHFGRFRLDGLQWR